MAGSIRDVDDLEQAKQELAKKDAQLVQQQKLDAVGSLASGISHEFNNLLQTIQGYTRFAVDSLPSESQASKDLQQVLRATERAKVLTRQLLDFSRSQEVDTQPCQIDQVIQQLVEMLQPLLPNEIDLQLLLNARSTLVLIDARHIQQALLNLCINARDAMPEGGNLTIQSEIVELTAACVASLPKLPPGEYVLVTVTDTGVGIPYDVQQHIFEPFYTTKEVGKGTGLGLAVTFGVIQQAGGHIDFQSQPHSGTTFQIYLPACQEKSLDLSNSTRPDTKELSATHENGLGH